MVAKPILKPLERQTAPEPADALPWPGTEKDLSPIPRLFRIHRLSSFEWQAYAQIPGAREHPIGKPDVFDIIRSKVTAVMRLEGQREYLANKRLGALHA